MRMLMVGYFEGLDSERGICWRCADSLSLKEFLGFRIEEATPDHSSLSRIRTRLSEEVHQAAFDIVLQIVAKKGSNADWKCPVDPEARIVKMKDGSPHLAHSTEHAVDMKTGVIVAATIQDATVGDL